MPPPEVGSGVPCEPLPLPHCPLSQTASPDDATARLDDVFGSVARSLLIPYTWRMPYQLKGVRAEGGEIGAWTEGAKAALRTARRWADQGVKNIMITNRKGECYDLDHFGMIASTKHDKDE
jgi:hypothetical protein